MKKHPSEVIRQIVLKMGYRENPDGTLTHSKELELENPVLASLKRIFLLVRRVLS